MIATGSQTGPVNPFRASQFRPGKIPFLFPEGESLESLCRRFANGPGRGQIVGPHGSGKSTLLRQLAVYLSRTGSCVHLLQARRHCGPTAGDSVRPTWRRPRCLVPAGSHQPPVTSVTPVANAALKNFDRCALPHTAFFDRVLLLDGFEQLSRWRRFCVIKRCAQKSWGLMVTSHRDVGLPLLMQTEVNLQMVRYVLAHLQVGESLASREIHELLRRHRGNVREILFELYDRYQLSRDSS